MSQICVFDNTISIFFIFKIPLKKLKTVRNPFTRIQPIFNLSCFHRLFLRWLLQVIYPKMILHVIFTFSNI